MRETEAQFETWVIQLAQLRGWMVAHFRPALTAKGWRTPVSADGKGFPDLVLVRERVLFVELKSDTGKLDEAQGQWLARLWAGGAEAYLWRPSMREQIERTLA